jgi:hypothetical protein
VTEWANLSPADRATHQRAVTDTGRTSASVHTRTPDGRPLIDGKLSDGTIPQADGKTAPVDSAALATDSGEKVRVGSYDVSEQEIRDLLAGKAERDLARAEVPANPTDYKIEIPAAANLPEGTAVALRNDPESAAMIDAAQQWSHKYGLPQSAFNELVAIQAQGVVAGQQRYNELKAVNLAELGSTGPQRIDGLVTWIRSQVGDADAKPIIATLATAAHVRFFEKLQHRIASQGVSSFNGSGRVEEPRGVDEATWNTMSYSEKKSYAERASSPGNRR